MWIFLVTFHTARLLPQYIVCMNVNVQTNGAATTIHHIRMMYNPYYIFVHHSLSYSVELEKQSIYVRDVPAA